MASSSSLKDEEYVTNQLQDLQKQMFEEAVSSINALLLEIYPSASPSLRKLLMPKKGGTLKKNLKEEPRKR